jgi:hypothetical protein
MGNLQENESGQERSVALRGSSAMSEMPGRHSFARDARSVAAGMIGRELTLEERPDRGDGGLSAG